MRYFISLLIYIFVIVFVSSLLFFMVTSIWDSSEPGLVFLLSIICTQLFLSQIGRTTGYRYES